MRAFRDRTQTTRRWLVAGVAALASLGVVTSGSAAPAGSADLAIRKTDSPDPVRVGSRLTYSIAVQNRGPSAASGVTVTDSLPAGVDFVSAAASSGACSQRGRKVSCQLGTIPFGVGVDYSGGSEVTIAVIPRQAGTVTNTAAVKGDQKDPNKADNSATTSTRVLDVARCRGLAATQTGTAGSDVLTGTGGPDVIVALGGADTIRTGAGRDLVCVGSGRDLVAAGSAADRLFGGADRDRLLGRGGPDSIRGGAGFDRCVGGPGRDSIRSCER